MRLYMNIIVLIKNYNFFIPIHSEAVGVFTWLKSNEWLLFAKVFMTGSAFGSITLNKVSIKQQKENVMIYYTYNVY